MRRPAGSLVLLLACAVAAPSLALEPPTAPEVVFQRHNRDAWKWLGGAGPYYPDVAARAGMNGQVFLDCEVRNDGRLDDCKVNAEAPKRVGFGDAARLMAVRGWIRAPAAVRPASGAPPRRLELIVPFVLKGRPR